MRLSAGNLKYYNAKAEPFEDYGECQQFYYCPTDNSIRTLICYYSYLLTYLLDWIYGEIT